MDYPVLRIWFLVHLPISLYFNNLFCTLWTLLYYYSTFIVAGILSWPNMDFLLATCGSSNCGCDCGWCTWNATQNWRRIWKRAFGSYVSLCTIFYSSQKYPPPPLPRIFLQFHYVQKYSISPKFTSLSLSKLLPISFVLDLVNLFPIIGLFLSAL